MKDKRLFLLDGNALVYRAHFAFISRPLMNSKGMNTSAITGFVRSLWDIITNQNPSHIAVSFDVSDDTFRKEIYPEYKANREAQPDEIRMALPYIHKILEGFQIPIIKLPGYEADDIIGTLAKQAEKEGYQVFMVTPDKDFSQLVSENIFLFKPSRQGNGVEILGESEIIKKWNIRRVDQVVDVLGLQGDSVDNIPGVPGVGPKTASTLLSQYEDIEDVIAHVEDLKGKLKERIRDNADQARMSKELATIDTNVPIEFDSKAYRLSQMDKPKLLEIFKELEFRTLSDAILGYEGNQPKPGVQTDLFGNMVETEQPKPKTSIVDKNIRNTPHQYKLLESEDEIKNLVSILTKQKLFCFDTESSALDAHSARLLGISIAYLHHEAFYIPMPENEKDAKERLSWMSSVLCDPKIKKIGQNLKYDIVLLRRYGIDIQGDLEDTMIAHYLLEPDKRHNMDYLSATILNYEPISISSLIGSKGKKQLSLEQIDVHKVLDYAAEDADITLQLHKELFSKLEQDNLLNLYQKIEQPLIRVLADMEFNGVRIDTGMLAAYSEELKGEIVEIEKEIYEQAGVRFNIGSPKQVGEVLFDKLKIPYRWRKTKSGQYSTDEDKMNELSKSNEIVADILRHRMLSKLKSTYVDALPNLVNNRTGRIHSSFNQALAATGRLSSNNPNLQNIPIRTPEGRKIRAAFVPKNDEYLIFSADYSQIELRLIAHISGDQGMIDAFSKGQDIHRATAAKVYDVAYDAVTDDQRRNAKTVNFSIIYGAGATNLARQLDIKRSEAKPLIDQYFKQYTGLKKYMEDTVDFARKNGFVETVLGRRRFIHEINSKSSFARSGAERIAINTPIQGTAADMIKLAMNDIFIAMRKRNLKSKMIMQVHDELVFDLHRDEIEIMEHLVEENMKNAIGKLDVPILVGMGKGENWLVAH